MLRIHNLPTFCLGFISLLFLSACGTSPDPAFYTLAVSPGMQTEDIKETIKVVQPDVPHFLDRPDFVTQTTSYQISVNETANWAEPLTPLFERILAADLQQRLPAATLSTDADDDVTAPPRYIIETKLQQFNPTHDQTVLRGDLQWTDLKVSNQPKHVIINLTLQQSSLQPSVTAANMSALIGQYADEIVSHLKSDAHP